MVQFHITRLSCHSNSKYNKDTNVEFNETIHSKSSRDSNLKSNKTLKSKFNKGTNIKINETLNSKSKKDSNLKTNVTSSLKSDQGTSRLSSSSQLAADTKRSTELVLVYRLISVVISDFLCWFPIGVLGLLASQGYAIPSEVNVAMAIFVLPLNSALNPFLYSLNRMREKARDRNMAKLTKVIQNKLKYEKKPEI